MPTKRLDKTQALRKPIAMLQRDYRPLAGMAKPPSQTLPPHEGEGLGLEVKIAYSSDWFYGWSTNGLRGRISPGEEKPKPPSSQEEGGLVKEVSGVIR